MDDRVDELTDLLDVMPRGGTFTLEDGTEIHRQGKSDPDGWEYEVFGTAGLTSDEAAWRALKG